MGYGLPLVCPSCSRGPAAKRRYYGVLKEGRFPEQNLAPSKRDLCPNCKTQLVIARGLAQ